MDGRRARCGARRGDHQLARERWNHRSHGSAARPPAQPNDGRAQQRDPGLPRGPRDGAGPRRNRGQLPRRQQLLPQAGRRGQRAGGRGRCGDLVRRHLADRPLPRLRAHDPGGYRAAGAARAAARHELVLPQGLLDRLDLAPQQAPPRPVVLRSGHQPAPAAARARAARLHIGLPGVLRGRDLPAEPPRALRRRRRARGRHDRAAVHRRRRRAHVRAAPAPARTSGC